MARARAASAAPIRWSLPITNAQVQQLIRAEPDPRKALAIYHSATAESPHGYRHDSTTLSLILTRLSSSPSLLPAAESLLSDPSLLPLPLPEPPFLPLLRSVSRARHPSAALHLFRRMLHDFQCRPTSKTYVTVLDILVDANELKRAQEFFREMRTAGFHRSPAAQNVLIKAFCKSEKTIGTALKVFDKMPERDGYTYGTLISGLCKLGMIDKAVEVFTGMRDRVPDVVTYSAVVHGYCTNGRLEDAVRVFEEMGEKGVKPNVVTYGALVDGLCKGGRTVDALGVLERMRKSRCKPNMVTYSSVVDGLVKEGRLTEAIEVMDKMRLHGCKPDAGLYKKLIVGLVDARRHHEAANFLDEMILSGVAPNRLTRGLHVVMHNVVIRGLCVGKDLGRAFQVYLGARTRSVTIEPETFHVVVDSFCKKGDVDRATRVVDEMLSDGCHPNESTWNTMMSGVLELKETRVAVQSTLDRIHDGCGSLN